MANRKGTDRQRSAKHTT